MTEYEKNNTPEILFEVSWEVCNKVGGIHTVLKTKCQEVQKKYGEHYVVIGPDIWREEHENPEFIEDEKLFLGWKEQAYAAGLRFRTGRWNIPGKPIALIIDFTPLISHKNEIFSKAWEDYKLDSLTGGWDYVESVLFGYASGLIIKSFIEYYRYDQVVAQFHEWMTGMGILYLEKEAPYIGTVFTTHATTVGRSISGNGLPLYEKLSEYNGDEMSNRLNVTAKHSLEKLSAITANQFTTVSSITADECEQLLTKRPDVITPNGFDPDLVPDRVELQTARNIARQQMRKVVEAVLGYSLDQDTIFIGTSGRYEYRNKGLDLFIDALGRLNRNDHLNKQVVALIMVPAHNYGPRKSITSRINGEHSELSGSRYLTHNLHNAQDDIILKALAAQGLMNGEGDPVKAVFIPCYLNGNDGIVNLSYYQILAGLDYTVFPSYYEPWGYTPLESLAFGVPTLTTDLAGFGLWVSSFKSKTATACAAVLPRRSVQDAEAVTWLEKNLNDFLQLDESARQTLVDKAFKVSKEATWDKLLSKYFEAYKASLSHVSDIDRPEQEIPEGQTAVALPVSRTNEPSWKRIFVESSFPDSLQGLDEISKNLWWTWNYEAEDLFRQIDPDLWEVVEHNPILLMRQIPLVRLQELSADKEFNDQYQKVYADFKNYLDDKQLRSGPQIAYFSMEYGMHSSLKIYSGGLGILAGDYLKEASDQNVPLVAVGLLYRYGYFRQVLTINGDQIAEDHPELFASLPVEPVQDENGQWIQVQVALPGRMLHVRLWKTQVGRISLYLMDTDFEPNQPHDRSITYHLYGGNEENRLKQEMVLGVAGIRMLNKLGITPDVYHCNEGHAAFINLERIRLLMEVKRFTFEESREVVRASTLFTTHTPVPAGHDTFTEDLIRTYMGHYPERLNISWSEFINLGRVIPDNPNERFSMSNLACRLSQEVNAVSRLHGEVTRQMFSSLWNGYYPEELHIGYVTNGVHYRTWTADIWQKLHREYFGPEFLNNQSDKSFWEKIQQVPDERIWNIRNGLRSELISYLQSRLRKVSIRRHEPPRQILEIMDRLDHQALTIGFARRFATYKRAHLLFKDLERLSRIVNNPDMPVQFIFAGKAHPNDKAGQDLIRYIVEISRKPEFRGKIIFLENYDMTLARKLVQGVDIWLNTPTRPLEASGTSGMKAAMNGVMNFSVLDGWWVEGYQEGAGWALPKERIYEDQGFQDELDAALIYNMLESQIVPLFYSGKNGTVPTAWIKHIKNTMAGIAPNFTTRRMIDDYFERFYHTLGNRISDIQANNYHLAREISRWKKRIANLWDAIEIEDVIYSKMAGKPTHVGETLTIEVVLRLGALSPDDIGVEIVIVSPKANGDNDLVSTQEFDQAEKVNGSTRYSINQILMQPGVFNYGIRIFPKSNLLPNRQDFTYLRWI